MMTHRCPYQITIFGIFVILLYVGHTETFSPEKKRKKKQVDSAENLQTLFQTIL